MEKAISYDIHGLKCDVCDFSDESIKVTEYRKWVNKPCPKCGANLLTEADFNFVQMMIKMTNEMNEVLPPREKEDVAARVEFDLNGTGNVNIKVKNSNLRKKESNDKRIRKTFR